MNAAAVQQTPPTRPATRSCMSHHPLSDRFPAASPPCGLGRARDSAAESRDPRTPLVRAPPRPWDHGRTCCAGSLPENPTDLPWSPCSRGCPPACEITTKEIADQLARRRLGYGRGARMKFEQDVVTHPRRRPARAAPWAARSPIQVGNTEWPKWEQIMAADPVDPELLAGLARNAPLTRPRPGHADLAGMQKYGFDDARPVLERASARETAARVALGTVASTSCARSSAPRSSRTWSSIGEADAVRRPAADPGRPGGHRRLADPLAATPSRPGDVRGDRRLQGGRRHPRRRRRGAGLRPAAGPRLATCTATASSTPGWPAR